MGLKDFPRKRRDAAQALALRAAWHELQPLRNLKLHYFGAPASVPLGQKCVLKAFGAVEAVADRANAQFREEFTPATGDSFRPLYLQAGALVATALAYVEEPADVVAAMGAHTDAGDRIVSFATSAALMILYSDIRQSVGSPWFAQFIPNYAAEVAALSAHKDAEP